MPHTYITPNATVVLLKDIPLSSDYEHTLFFKKEDNENLSQARARQKNVFMNQKYLVRTLTNQMYKRVNNNTIKVACKYDDIYMCNYMLFENRVSTPGYSHKLYYAFIDEVNYISEGTSEIVYTIDVMQTWMFDYRLTDCFVEREHSATDAIGDNTVPEPVDAGDYIVEKTEVFTKPDPDDPEGDPVSIVNGEYSVVIAAPWKATVRASEIDPLNPVVEFEKDANGVFYGQSFSGIYYNHFKINNSLVYGDGGGADLRALMDSLKRLTHQDEMQEIVAIYICPTMANLIDSSFPLSGSWQFSTIQLPLDWTYIRNGVQAIPRNNKIYTYPYSKLCVTSSDGAMIEYKYEKMRYAVSSHECVFRIEGTPGCPPEILAAPMDYDGVDTVNYSHSITIQNFPLCSWITDTFKAWLAQNSTKMLASAVGAAAALAFPLPATAMMFAQLGLATNVASSLGSIASATFLPDDAHGVSKAMIGCQNNELGFRLYHLRIKDEYAGIVDDYFTKFGYATKRVKVPNRDVRPHWCYCETKGCAIIGITPDNFYSDGLPAAANKEICSIYDKGITFWKDIDEIGNYQLDNSVTP